MLCLPGSEPIDTNGDGCPDTCKKICLAIKCAADQMVADSDGDGCNDVCKCGPMQKCPANYQATHTNGNTCLDT